PEDPLVRESVAMDPLRELNDPINRSNLRTEHQGRVPERREPLTRIKDDEIYTASTTFRHPAGASSTAIRFASQWNRAKMHMYTVNVATCRLNPPISTFVPAVNVLPSQSWELAIPEPDDWMMQERM